MYRNFKKGRKNKMTKKNIPESVMLGIFGLFGFTTFIGLLLVLLSLGIFVSAISQKPELGEDIYGYLIKNGLPVFICGIIFMIPGTCIIYNKYIKETD
jgi:hypothetical protein